MYLYVTELYLYTSLYENEFLFLFDYNLLYYVHWFFIATFSLLFYNCQVINIY